VKNRLIISLFLVPLTFYVYLKGEFSFYLFINFVTCIGIHEFYRMVKARGIEASEKIGMSISIIFTSYLYFTGSGMNRILPFALTLSVVVLFLSRIINNEVKGTISYLGCTLLGFVYVTIMFDHIILIKELTNGAQWLVTIQILIWISDTFAYLTGSLIGKKYYPNGLCEVSPNKSIEGSLGAIGFTIVFMIIIKIFLFRGLNISGIHLLLLPILISIVGQIGDLAESILKREFEIKDSGRVLGGHGGVLDRFDSLLFVFPFAFYYINYFL